MADPNDNDETSGDSAQQPQGPRSAPGFRVGNVLKLVIPLVLLIGAGFVFVGFFDGLNLISSMSNPVLVSATGQVIYRGKPLEGAVVTTRHTGGKMRGSFGWTDADGQFTLQTDINGYVDGAYAGEHQVMVTSYESMSSVVGAPPLITPQIYASFETTPLRFTVSEVAGENKFVLTLEGDPPARPSGNAGGGGGGFNPETIVGRVFENYDKDGDDQLSEDEMQAIEADRVERIRGADANEDGVVSRDELLAAFSLPRRPELE